MTTNPTPCGWAGQTCDRPARFQTWQTTRGFADRAVYDRPLCAYHLETELVTLPGRPDWTLHIAALGVEVTR